MEQLIANGAEDMASVFSGLFDLAMRIEREQFLEAGHYERTPLRRGYANGVKPKRLDTPAGTVTVNVPKTAGHDEPFYPQSLEQGRRSSRARDAGGGRDVRQRRLDPRCRGGDEGVRY